MSTSFFEAHTNLIKIRVIKLLGLQNIKISSQINYYLLKFNNVIKKFCYNESDRLDFIFNLNSSDLSFNLELIAGFSDDSIKTIGYINLLNLLSQNEKEICFQQVSFTLNDLPSAKPVVCQLVIHSPPNNFKYKPLKEFLKSDFGLDKSEIEQNDEIILENDKFTLFTAFHIQKNKKYIIKQYKLKDISKSQDSDQKKFLTVSDIQKIKSTNNYDTLLQVVGFIKCDESELLQLGKFTQRGIKLEPEKTKKVALNEEGNPYWSILEGYTAVSDFDFDDPNPKVIENLNEEGNPIWAILDGEKSVREKDIVIDSSITKMDSKLLENQEDDQIISCIVYSNIQHESNSSSKSKKSIITLNDLIHNRDKKISKYGNNNKTRIMYEITQALYIIHYQGNAHRHLNPSNILVNTKTLKVKLFDYEMSSENIGKDLNKIYYSQELKYDVVGKQTKNLHNDFASDILALGLIFFEISTGKKKDRNNDFDFAQLSSNLRFMCRQMIDQDPYNRPYVEEVLHLFKTVNFGIYDTNSKKVLSTIEKLDRSTPKGLSFLMQYDQAQVDRSYSNYSGLLAFKMINDKYSNSDDFLEIQKEVDSMFIDSILGHLLMKGNEKIEKNEELGSKLLEQSNKSEEEPDYHFCLFNFDDINSSDEPDDFSLWWQYQQIRTGMIDSSIYFCNLDEGQIKAKYIDHLEKIIEFHQQESENPYVSFSLGMLLRSKECPVKESEEEIENLIETGFSSNITRSLSIIFLRPTEEHLNKKLIGATHNSLDVIKELTFYYNDINNLNEAKKFAKIGSANKIGLCEKIRGEILLKEGNEKEAQRYFELAKKHTKVEISDNDFDFDSDDENQVKKSNDENNQRFAYNSDDGEIDYQVNSIRTKSLPLKGSNDKVEEEEEDNEDETENEVHKMKKIDLSKGEIIEEEEEMSDNEDDNKNTASFGMAPPQSETNLEEEEEDKEEQPHPKPKPFFLGAAPPQSEANLEEEEEEDKEEQPEPRSKPFFLGAAPPLQKVNYDSDIADFEEEEEDFENELKIDVVGDHHERAITKDDDHDDDDKPKEEFAKLKLKPFIFSYENEKPVQSVEQIRERNISSKNKTIFDELEDGNENADDDDGYENFDDEVAVNENDENDDDEQSKNDYLFGYIYKDDEDEKENVLPTQKVDTVDVDKNEIGAAKAREIKQPENKNVVSTASNNESENENMNDGGDGYDNFDDIAAASSEKESDDDEDDKHNKNDGLFGHNDEEEDKDETETNNKDEVTPKQPESDSESISKQPESDKDANTSNVDKATSNQPESINTSASTKDDVSSASSSPSKQPESNFEEVNPSSLPKPRSRSLAFDRFDDTIESLISQKDAASLILYLHEKNDHDLTNSVFNRLYMTDKPFYTSTVHEGVKLNNAVSLHKQSLSLISNGTKEDIKTARQLLELSTKLGFNLSYFTLSRLVYEVYHENEFAFKLAREGAARNEKYSKALLGHYISKGVGVQKQEESGVLMMLDSDAEDFYQRYSTDIALYFIGKDDKETAFKWFERAYSINKTNASVNNIGICYMRGIGIEKDANKALQIFTSNGQIGEPLSTYYRACIAESSGLENSEEESLRLFKEAAENGSVEAQSHYAYLMREKDPEISMKFFEMAAKKGHAASQVCLGFLKENDEADISLSMYKKAAERGSSKAQAYLAMKFSRENDPENTFKYMKMCIRTGQDIVPLEYAKFLYDKKNFKLAFDYFNLVASVNNPIARFFIGLMKFKGEGCEENRDEAYSIMKKLADQKIERAAQFIEDNFE